MKPILTKLIQHNALTKEDAKSVLINISNQQYNPSQVSAFLTVYMMRTITVQELEGFQEAMVELCVPVDLSEYNCIDIVGTGGDGKDTFNISTLASFVTAGAGVNVSKHGNYGVSSVCGSSNVLECLGIKLSGEVSFLRRCLDASGFCMMHAPLFHPAMKNVAPIRKELGVRTFFNMLGTITNPAQPKSQMIGTFNLELARIYAYLNQNKGNKNYAIIHALDGYDEISLTGGAKIITNSEERIIYPEKFGVASVNPSEIRGGKTVEESAQIFMNILTGKGTEPQHNVVCANAAVAISIAKQRPLKDSYQDAKYALESGEALKRLKRLQDLST